MRTLILLLLAFFLATNAEAATCIAASTSQTDVQACFSVVNDGDTISIPSGTSDWAGVAIANTKGVTVIGAGAGNTVFKNAGISMNVPLGKSWRLTGFTMDTGTSGIGVGGGSQAWRIDHITFSNIASGGGYILNRIIWVQPGSSADILEGVIDHNTFTNNGIIHIHMRSNNADAGNASWNRVNSLGGAEAVFIETNTFNNPTYLGGSAAAIDSDGGARWVFRYNTVINNYLEQHDAIITNFRGVRQWEIYNNTFQKTYNSGQSTWLHLRGGIGLAYNNTFTGPGTTGGTDNAEIQMHLYRADGTLGGNPWTTACPGTTTKACLVANNTYARYCTTDSDCAPAGVGSCILIDGVGAPGGHPCRDQLGWDMSNPVVSLPVLFWSNKYVVGGADVVLSVGGAGNYTLGVDYCTNSTTMPASCNGVTTTYTPYTYPHPLVGGALPAPTNPSSHHGSLPTPLFS